MRGNPSGVLSLCSKAWSSVSTVAMPTMGHASAPVPAKGSHGRTPTPAAWGRMRPLWRGAARSEYPSADGSACCGGVARGAEFALLFGPLTRVSGLSAEQREAVRWTFEGFFQSYATPQGVALPSAFSLVQAHAERARGPTPTTIHGPARGPDSSRDCVPHPRGDGAEGVDVGRIGGDTVIGWPSSEV